MNNCESHRTTNPIPNFQCTHFLNSDKDILKKFRLPRKIKKTLKGQIWLYPADENGNSQMAFPSRSQKDYTALKKGILKNLIDQKNARTRRKELSTKLNKEITIPDEDLKRYVENIFRDEFRNSSFKTLLKAKRHPKAITGYYHFVNAYHLYEKGDESFGNICCLAVDKAKALLKKK